MDDSAAIREPSQLDALIPLAFLVASIAGALALFGLDALDGPVQVALILSSMVAALVALKNGYTWDAVQQAAQGSLASITSAVFILFAVGALIGVWNLSGTIPTLVYYGIQVLSPGWYYAATALICGVVALSIGSSWTTAGTIGVGLVGIATAIGVSPEITAGAVVSGAYLGDKTSPLSETTVLAAQLVGVDVRDHIRYQLLTSGPAFAIALLVFLVLGVAGPEVDDTIATSVELEALDGVFNITPLNLLPLVLLGVMSAKKVPASLALMLSTLFAGAMAVVLQPEIVADFVPGAANAAVESIEAVWQAMATGFSIETGVAEIDGLVSRGGMASMLPTIWLIVGAVTFGALLDELGLLRRLIDPLIDAARTTARLFAAVFASAFGLNIFAGDQYIALVLPIRLYRKTFDDRGLDARNLSRLAADSGTVTSALVPWNSCGAFMAAVLGVATLDYLPFAVFNYTSPLINLLLGITGVAIARVTPAGPAAGRRSRDDGERTSP